MLKVGTYEAKTRLSELIERVEAGEQVAITRHGETVALLVPCKPESRKSSELIARWRKRQHDENGPRLNGVSVRELINKGRR